MYAQPRPCRGGRATSRERGGIGIAAGGKGEPPPPPPYTISDDDRGSPQTPGAGSAVGLGRRSVGVGVRLNKLFLSHPVSFPFLFSLQHPLFSSLFSRGNHQIFRALSRDPSPRLVWGRPKISQIGEIPGILRVYLENPGYTWKISCDRLGIVPISSILRQILPQTSSQTQGNSRVSRMEHQTPSVFPGNFRKRKVLGTLCFPF